MKIKMLVFFHLSLNLFKQKNINPKGNEPEISKHKDLKKWFQNFDFIFLMVHHSSSFLA
ncbi:Hypothetical Protein SLY_0429 [Strawberry lethal yellows phytoplasma (CPA) str. NZSb11]|uniref:Uncharacterized protein n=1 Tax=Strawberry lethal yellows phytoplasma (CPA) str. NZSb11 TaxID=980422 RepID=R4S0M3_PHYAS|nr:Hypothetical Protein SLY_0429 [Strawberry lethal yellows phytoplasma (CPA) str. NZSb11]